MALPSGASSFSSNDSNHERADGKAKRHAAEPGGDEAYDRVDSDLARAFEGKHHCRNWGVHGQEINPRCDRVIVIAAKDQEEGQRNGDCYKVLHEMRIRANI
jgi:hypothetical protein